ncbi:AI-2E family transporter [Candidatus Saccharibacteria bacterium]|nr:AI-2E family transporter [Candidatus Saccharibacteria bacterium]
MLTVTGPQKRALAIATILAIVLGAYFLSNYVGLLIVAAITAFVFNPLYQLLLKRWNNKNKAATVTLLATFVAVIIPLTFVLAVTLVQVNRVIGMVNLDVQNTDLNQLLTNVIDSINQVLATIGLSFRLSIDHIQAGLATMAQNIGDALLQGLSSSISSVAAFITTFIIYIYVFLALLTKQDKLIETFHLLNPLGKDIGKLYLRRAGVMTKGMVRGQFIIATVQGFTDAFFLYLAGFRSTFFFFFMILTVLSIIPLGGGIIVIPIGIIMILLGNIWQGALILAGHFLIVTNEDNILRPKLVPDEARLDPALTLLSVFSGLAFFGFIGIVVGPVIMILIVTTIEVYMEVFRDIKRKEYHAHEKSSLLAKPIRYIKGLTGKKG